MDFSVDALLPKYTILCLFTHISNNNGNIAELFGKLADTSTFDQFVEHTKDKDVKEVCTEFVKNTIYSMYDNQAKIIIEDEELNSIFTDNSLKPFCSLSSSPTIISLAK